VLDRLSRRVWRGILLRCRRRGTPSAGSAGVGRNAEDDGVAGAHRYRVRDESPGGQEVDLYSKTGSPPGKREGPCLVASHRTQSPTVTIPPGVDPGFVEALVLNHEGELIGLRGFSVPDADTGAAQGSAPCRGQEEECDSGGGAHQAGAVGGEARGGGPDEREHMDSCRARRGKVHLGDGLGGGPSPLRPCHPSAMVPRFVRADPPGSCPAFFVAERLHTLQA